MELSQPIKWHGGKSYLAKLIIELMPPRRSEDHPDGWLHYVEPFAGGLAVLLHNDHEGISEVANDLSGDLANFWRVLQDDHLFERLRRLAEATPFCEKTWERAAEQCERQSLRRGMWQPAVVDRAMAFFIWCRQSLAGRMKSFAPLSRTRTRRGMSEQASAWLTAIEGLPAVHERLKRVVILNRPALEVIRGQDGPRTLYYCDPPYLHSTRATTGDYACEMTEADHEEMLETLLKCQGKVMLSGYRNELYDAKLASWRRVDWDVANHAAGGETKRRAVESLWLNFAPPSAEGKADDSR